jgi:xyloglucan-specific exo-beta-1,4-glucanase
VVNFWDINIPQINKAPWINNSRSPTDTKILGWMVASLEIDPFDSDHWLYGTGLTIYGGHDLTKFPNVHVQSLADGIEEEAVLSLIAPPGGVPLLSAVGDDGGFRHINLDISPNNSFQNPFYSTTSDLDYAGAKLLNIVRIGNSNSAGVVQMALSTDGGVSFNPATVCRTSIAGGQVAYGTDGVNNVWMSGSGVYRFSSGAQSTISLTSSGDCVAASWDTTGLVFVGTNGRGIFYGLP